MRIKIAPNPSTSLPKSKKKNVLTHTPFSLCEPDSQPALTGTRSVPIISFPTEKDVTKAFGSGWLRCDTFMCVLNGSDILKGWVKHEADVR